MNIKDLFSYTYEESREKFRDKVKYVKSLWPETKIESHKVLEAEDLSIDIIIASAKKNYDKLLIVTTGLHGIEGYIGAAMLNLLIDKYLNKLDYDSTGIVLVHAINPWGMKHMRRTNENNIDLNRNFIWQWSSLEEKLNKDYQKIESFLNPQQPYCNKLWNNVSFNFGLLKALFKIGFNSLKNAPILGQYQFPAGIYYGGQGYEDSTRYMIDLYRRCIRDYRRIVLLDIHTGYGPGNLMSIVNSVFEKRSSAELKKAFVYPLVQKTDTKEFYKIKGDMIDFLYMLIAREFKDKQFYSTTLEFGTYGDSIISALKSLQVIIEENRLYRYGVKYDKDKKNIRKNFLNLFAPTSEEWRSKAIKDFRQGLNGILTSEGFI